jgi:hypothetical protein
MVGAFFITPLVTGLRPADSPFDFAQGKLGRLSPHVHFSTCLSSRMSTQRLVIVTKRDLLCGRKG